MSSPLMFVRDGRTLPFVPVTLAAMAAIRAAVSRRRPFAVATYVALLELANADRADRVSVTQRQLVEITGAGRTSVQQALADLQEAGVLVVQPRRHGLSRLENEYVVVEPDGGAISDTLARHTGDPLARHTGDPCSPGEQLVTKSYKEPSALPSAPAREPAPAKDPRESLPNGFPAELRPHAKAVYRLLREVAEQHGSRRVWPLQMGRLMMRNSKRPLVARAHDLHEWAVDPGRRVKDVLATYRTFLSDAPQLEGFEVLDEEGRPAARPAGNVVVLGRSSEAARRAEEKRLRAEEDRAAIARVVAAREDA